MADQDEEWTGPVEEASKPLGERLETIEAGGVSEAVTEAVPPIEERVARLERIAEYLHEAREEATVLASSVDTLAEATRVLTGLLTAIDAQQQRIEGLDTRVGESEVSTEAFRKRISRRALLVGLALAVFFTVIGVLFWRQERTTERIEAEATARALAQEQTVERIGDESKARGLANCVASNDSRAAIRDFIMVIIESNERPDRDSVRDAQVLQFAEEGFPSRDCEAELAEAEATVNE